MAVLSQGERDTVQSSYCAAVSARWDVFNLSAADMAATVAAVDSWVNDNQASYNSALPAAAQSGLSATQKAEILLYVVRRRYEVGV